MSLMRSISTLRSNQEFKALTPTLTHRFADAVAVVEHLDGRGHDLDEIDAIYRVLVEAAQQRSVFATAALWLGLWKGLDAIYRRWLHRFGSGEAMVSEIGTSFSLAVQAANLDAIEQLAATLVWNTERRIVDGREREDRRIDREDGLPAMTPEMLRVEAPKESALGMSLPGSGELGVHQVRDWLRQRLSVADTTLIVATELEGQTQKDFADDHGLTAVAIRKRHQRALARLRAMSHFGESQRVFRVRGKRPPPRRRR